MIDIRKLKELVRLMVSNDLTELDLRDSEEQVTLRRTGPASGPMLAGPPMVTHAAPAFHAAPGAQGAAGVPGAAGGARDGADESDLHMIESPMVGTFYSAADPDSPPFVSVGDRVDENTVVCLIEAMKIFNEIKAECSGTIEKVLVSNAEAVEFGQALYAVRAD